TRPMKTKLLCTVVLVLTLSLTSFGGLGETLDQCKLRYNSPTGSNANEVFFSSNHMVIAVQFLSDRAIQMDFSPELGDTFSETQVAEILRENAEGSTWEINGDTPAMITYLRKDGRATAQCAKKGITLNTKGALVTLKYTVRAMHE